MKTKLLSLFIKIFLPAFFASNERPQLYPNQKQRWERWKDTGISHNMIVCGGLKLISQARDRRKGIIEFGRVAYVKVENEVVSVEPFDRNVFVPLNDAAESRSDALKFGIEAAISFAKKHLNVSHFPNFEALLMPTDGAAYPQSRSSMCNMGDRDYYWPPIFAQNRENGAANLFVTVPDFSFFTDFKYPGNHGDDKDRWFDVIMKEVYSNSTTTTFNPVPFHEKSFNHSVWRGKVTKRKWGAVRTALAACNQSDFIDSDNEVYMSKEDMCLRHKIIVTVPGNGVWSWATKFNLVSQPRFPHNCPSNPTITRLPSFVSSPDF